jgi:hypothetical protein
MIKLKKKIKKTPKKRHELTCQARDSGHKIEITSYEENQNKL